MLVAGQAYSMIGVADALYPLVNLPLYNQLYNHTFTRLAGAVFLLSGFYGALALAAFGYPSHLTYPSYPQSFRLWPGPISESSGHNSLVNKFHSENYLNYSEDHLDGKTQTRNHGKSTDSGLEITLGMVFKTSNYLPHMVLHSIEYKIYQFPLNMAQMFLFVIT